MHIAEITAIAHKILYFSSQF